MEHGISLDTPKLNEAAESMINYVKHVSFSGSLPGYMWVYTTYMDIGASYPIGAYAHPFGSPCRPSHRFHWDYQLGLLPRYYDC